MLVFKSKCSKSVAPRAAAVQGVYIVVMAITECCPVSKEDGVVLEVFVVNLIPR